MRHSPFTANQCISLSVKDPPGTGISSSPLVPDRYCPLPVNILLRKRQEGTPSYALLPIRLLHSNSSYRNRLQQVDMDTKADCYRPHPLALQCACFEMDARISSDAAGIGDAVHISLGTSYVRARIWGHTVHAARGADSDSLLAPAWPLPMRHRAWLNL